MRQRVIGAVGAFGLVCVLVFAQHPSGNNAPGTITELAGSTASLGGSLLTAATYTSGTASVTGATTGMPAVASPVTYPGDGIAWMAYVSAADTVTVKICAIVALTPTASVYRVRVVR